MLFKLAFRNVFRYKRRTIITFSSISFGLGLMIAGFSLYKGIDKQSFDNIINSQTAHLNIFARGYFEKKDDIPLEITIDQPQKIKSILKNIKEIQALETRILFAASLIKGLDELPCLGVAVETEIDPLVFNIKDSLKEGNFLEASDQKIIIGNSLAKDLSLKVGDMCVLRMFISTEDYEVKSFEEMASDFVEVTKMKTRGQSIILLVMLLIATLGIVNTMLMAVLERTHEIGIIKSMGMRDKEIVFLILIEALFIGILGTSIGGLLGSSLSIIVQNTGIDFSQVMENIEVPIATFIGTTIYPKFTLLILIGSISFGLVTTLLAALYPAFKASRMTPVDALRTSLK